MRILHTSDWHVGRTIRGRSRAEEHVAVLREIADVAAREQVDVVIVAGDLFDTAAPPAEAEVIVYRALLELTRTGAQVVAVAGNHDNPSRLAAVQPLFRLAGVHIGAFSSRPDDGGVIDITTRSGEVARVALVPFLSQRSIVRAHELMTQDADQHVGSYAERCRRILTALAAPFASDTVNLLVAHLTVVGGTIGGSERLAHTIFDYFVPTQAFPADAHYVALGHLHRPQRIAGPCPMRYSGSPLVLDFGEAEGAKSVTLIDATAGVPATATEVPLTSGRRLRTLRGDLASLDDQRTRQDDAYLRIVVEEAPRAGLADEVRRWFPHAVDVTVVVPDRPGADDTWQMDALQRSPAELFAEYLEAHGVVDPPVQALFAELLEEQHAPDPA